MRARGSVIKRGNKYVVVLDLGRDRDGKRIRRWHSGYSDQQAAEEARTELLGRLDKGLYVTPSKVTLERFVEDKWNPSLDNLIATGRIRESTAASYKFLMKTYVTPKIGNVEMQELTSFHLLYLYGELATSGRQRVKDGGVKGLAPKTIRLVHLAVHRALRDAVKRGIVARNVATEATEDVPQGYRKVMKTWSPEELKTFLDHVRDDRLRALWVLLITTGLRRGEAAGLTWDALNLDAGRLQVRTARVVVNFQVVESKPKTEKSARTIALDPATVKALRTHWACQASEKLERGPEFGETNLVFTWEDGEPLHPDYISKSFQRLSKAAGLPAIRLHDLRHSFASAALEAGVPLKVVQERLGHKSIAITADIYSHVRPEVDQAAADKVAGLIFGSG